MPDASAALADACDPACDSPEPDAAELADDVADEEDAPPDASTEEADAAAPDEVEGAFCPKHPANVSAKRTVNNTSAM